MSLLPSAGFFGALCALILLLIVARSLRNLLFHPLRKYPGPIIARATRLYYVYYKIKGTLPFKTKELHDLYGPVVRVAPDELSYIGADAWQDICGHRSGTKSSSFGKEPRFYMVPENSGRVASIVTANDEDHRRMRRLQAHAFSERALLSQEPILIKYVDLLVKRLHEKTQEQVVVDLVKWYNFTTFDLIGDLAFGRSFNCLQTGELHSWISTLFDSLRIGNAMQSLRLMHKDFTKAIRPLISKKVQQKRGRQFAFAKELAKERISAGVKREDGQYDFMSYILRANDEKGMSLKEIEEAAHIYIVAGSETTASLLSGLTYYLLQNQRVYKKLADEIRSSFKSGDDMQLNVLAQLPYLNAVFEEALRMYPPAPSTLPRAVPAGGEFVLGDFLPGGTVVGINQWAANRCSANFHLPDEFIPERWLGDKRFDRDNKKAFQPFSFGPRNCIGRNLAYSEMRLIMSRMLWNFDMELAEEGYGWHERQRVCILWEKGPLMVKLTPRVIP